MTLTLPWVGMEGVLLAGVRIAAFLVIAPPFSHRAIPGTVKAMLALAIGMLVAPRARGAADPTDAGAFVGQLLLQVVVGIALGFLVWLVFTAVQSAGAVIDLFGGFQLAQAYDPMSMTSGA